MGMRLSACPAGGPRSRDRGLQAVGEPVLRAVPGYTISTDMGGGGDAPGGGESAAMVGPRLFVTPPDRAAVVNTTSSDATVLTAALRDAVSGGGGPAVIHVTGLAAGRARLSVGFSDGSCAVAHYHVLPPLHQQVAALTAHWAEVAWLPRDFPDPFGRGASVMPVSSTPRQHAICPFLC